MEFTPGEYKSDVCSVDGCHGNDRIYGLWRYVERKCGKLGERSRRKGDSGTGEYDRAKQITLSDYDKFDYIIGMDSANIRNLNRMLRNDPEGKVYKFLTFAGSSRDIADPWYTGDFDETYRDVVEGCDGFLKFLREKRKIDT